MKRFLFLVVLTGLVCLHLYAEDAASQSDGVSFSMPPVIFNVYPDVWFNRMSKTGFLLMDGSYLNYEEMASRISAAVPENEKYLRSAKKWETAAWTTSFIGTGSILACFAILCILPDFPNRDTWAVATAAGGFFHGFMSLTFRNAKNINMGLALKNYNLSVMGVPIPVK
jgi:hypothetical protein